MYFLGLQLRVSLFMLVDRLKEKQRWKLSLLGLLLEYLQLLGGKKYANLGSIACKLSWSSTSSRMAVPETDIAVFWIL